MANPPYSCGVLVIEEMPDGFQIHVAHWDDVIDETAGSGIPPAPADLLRSMSNGIPRPTFWKVRNAVSRAALKTAFGVYVDAKFAETA